MFVKNNGTQPRWPRLACRMNGLQKTNNFLISTQSRAFSTNSLGQTTCILVCVMSPESDCSKQLACVLCIVINPKLHDNNDNKSTRLSPGHKNYWARREINIGENDLFRVESSPGGDNDDDDASP